MPSSTETNKNDQTPRELVERAKRAFEQSSSSGSSIKDSEVGRLLSQYPMQVLGGAMAVGLLFGSPQVRRMAFKLGWTGVKFYAAKKLAAATAEAVTDDDHDSSNGDSLLQRAKSLRNDR